MSTFNIMKIIRQLTMISAKWSSEQKNETLCLKREKEMSGYQREKQVKTDSDASPYFVDQNLTL